MLEATVAETLAQRNIVATTTGDLLGEMVPNDLAFGGAAVDVDPQPGGPAAAVRRNDDVRPLVERQRLLGGHRDCVARPEVNQRPLEPAVLNEQLVAAATSICPGAGAMEDHGPILEI